MAGICCDTQMIAEVKIRKSVQTALQRPVMVKNATLDYLHPVQDRKSRSFETEDDLLAFFKFCPLEYAALYHAKNLSCAESLCYNVENFLPILKICVLFLRFL